MTGHPLTHHPALSQRRTIPRRHSQMRRINYTVAAENTSSTLATSTSNTPGIGCAPVAHSLHHPTRNRNIPGSNPTPSLGSFYRPFHPSSFSPSSFHLALISAPLTFLHPRPGPPPHGPHPDQPPPSPNQPRTLHQSSPPYLGHLHRPVYMRISIVPKCAVLKDRD